eukprot:TRINITY_DN93791_c0_g1_i1.p1 TRINITY_DN93791_c0_g1~~TRINITY_DN93791_c0_g1_i1.p1  ORF type:complete len:392 (-),score=28.35 TRINITY_DN93791_c0_g1_i1:134-1279(-)
MGDNPPRYSAAFQRSVLNGIQQCVKQTAEKYPEEPMVMGQSLFEQEVFHEIQCADTKLGTLSLKEYAPVPFQKFRKRCGVTPEAYMAAWDLPDEALTPKLGAGRSGSLFLHSNDGRFLFKTIPHGETITLLELLPAFYDHYCKNPSSLIACPTGLYKARQKGIAKDDILYVVVMANVAWNTAPDDQFAELVVYDLKGRLPKKGKTLRHLNDTGRVLKDNDLTRKFDMHPNTLDLFRQQVATDIKFMEGLNLMDYSFLIAVRKHNPFAPSTYNTTDHIPSPQSQSSADPATGLAQHALRTFYGGCPRDEINSEVYFMGFIDFLTRYNTKKKAAHLMKSLKWDDKQLSTVPPDVYGERLQHYLREIFVELGESIAWNPNDTTV